MTEAMYYDLKKVSPLSPSLSAHIVGELGRQIVSSKYAVGELLEDEAALSSRYNVSRSVVRDAVKILVGKGLLEVRRGIGTKVRPRNKWGLLDDDVLAWSQSAPPNPDTTRQLMETRLVFEPVAARWAAERADDEALQNITDAMDAMERHRDNIKDFVVADATFHAAILRATGNEFLIALEGIIFSALLNSIRLTNIDATDNDRGLPLHRDVCDAITARQPDEAEKRMRILLTDTRQTLAQRVEAN